VLNRGESEKDIDLYFIPLENPDYPPTDPVKLKEWLTSMWGQPDSFVSPYEYVGGNDIGAAPRARARVVRAPINLGAPAPAAANPAFVGQGFDQIGWAAGLVNQAVAPPAPPEPAPEPGSAYKYRLRFWRKGDRVDVFIIGS
jgi:hypothetical protein